MKRDIKREVKEKIANMLFSVLQCLEKNLYREIFSIQNKSLIYIEQYEITIFDQ